MLAKIKSKLDSEVHVSKRFDTLFTGLRVNHARNVAVAHPLVFFASRIVFVISVATLVHDPLISISVLMGMSMATLAFALHDQPWSEPLLNKQFIFNEVVLYTLVTLLFLNQSNLAET